MTESFFTAEARHEPWWWQEAPCLARAPAKLPARADVVIVGAGFTGLSAALTLARAGREVLLLEAEEPGSGASSRNGGMIGGGHRVSYAELTRRYGRETAGQIITEGLTSLAFTTELIEREQIQCQFQRSGRFRAAWRPKDYEAFGREAEVLRKDFGVELDMVPRGEQHREIATDAYHGGCVYHAHGGLHPALLHRGLLERAEAAGAAVRGQRPVTAIERDGSEFTVTAGGDRVRARDVIIASNGYTGAVTPRLRRRLVPIASYLIATEDLGAERVAELIPKGRMIVESRARHCYYRPAPDGRRILFGGRAALRAIDTTSSARILYRLMTGLFPDLKGVKITHSWTGFVAFSRDSLPHVGLEDGLHYALGYNGSGVAMAPYLGWKAAQKVLGRPEGKSPFDDLTFAPLPFYRGRPWFLRAVEGWYALKDRLEHSA